MTTRQTGCQGRRSWCPVSSSCSTSPWSDTGWPAGLYHGGTSMCVYHGCTSMCVCWVLCADGTLSGVASRSVSWGYIYVCVLGTLC